MKYIIRIAGIGSRGLNAEQLEHCYKLGSWIAKLGFQLHSGNADGADNAFQQGGCSIKSDLVYAHLPWPGFNPKNIHDSMHTDILGHLPVPVQEHYELFAAAHHPAWLRLTHGGQALHARNGRIIQPIPHINVDMILAWPSSKQGGGGTGQGMRMGEALGIPVVDLSKFKTIDDFRKLCEQLRDMKPKDHVGRTQVISVKDAPADWKNNTNYVYIGRPSAWGNPYTVEQYGQGQACEMHALWFGKQGQLHAGLKDLQGKILVCYCKPKRCHGDVLAHWADEFFGG